jgi:hypothetical protein
MARFGTGIQAGLGRIDYTPYTQGAISGAQNIGRGLASIGDVAGTAITSYFKRKEEEDKIGKDTEAFKTIATKPENKAIFESL